MVPPKFGAVWLSLVLLCGCVASTFAQGGAVDTTFNGPTPSSGGVSTMAVQSDGKIIVGGSFTALGTAVYYLARLNQNGSLDTTFKNTSPYFLMNGIVSVVVLQSDGRMLVAGSFSSISGTSRPGLARLNSDGTLDTTFNPGTGADPYSISALTIQADGKILVGGSFHSFNGDSTRGYLVRLNANGSVDSSFNLGSGFNAQVFSVVLQVDSRIVVGGRFITFNGTTRKSVVQLNTDGSLDTSFDPGSSPTGDAAAACVQSTGKILVRGNYLGSTPATTRYSVYRLNSDGSLDPSFDAGTARELSSAWLALAPDDFVLLAGAFTTVSGLTRVRVARLTPDGAVDPLFDAGSVVPASVNAIAVQNDGRVLVSPAGSAILRLLGTGTLPPPGPAPVLSSVSDGTGVRLLWSDTTLEEGYKIERSSDGTGNWSLVATTSGERLRRFYDAGLPSGTTYYYRVHAFNRYGDGAVSAPLAAATLAGIWPGQINLSLDPARGGIVGANVCVVQPDGKLIVSAQYQVNVGTPTKAVVARFNIDGTLDRLFDVVSDDSEIYSLLLQPDGKVVVGGRFKVANGTVQRSIGRFNPDGTEDTTFSALVLATYNYGLVYSLVLQTDGRLLVGGYFDKANGVAAGGVTRLNPDGSLDPAFNAGTGANSTVNAVALDANGRILIGGNFTAVNGNTCGRVARLTSTGAFDTTFTASPGANNTVKRLAIQADGRVLAAGSLTQYNSQTANGVVRLNDDGSRDSTFAVPSGPGSITGLLLQADGAVLIGGSFTQIGGIARRFVARLTNQGALDTGFDTVDVATFSSFCPLPDGRVIGTGSVTFDGGATQAGLALLSNSSGLPPPPKPQGLAVAVVNGSQLRLTWSDVPQETGYIIERSPNGSSGWMPVGQAGADTPTYLDTGLAQSTQYYYRVRSFNLQGTSLASDSAYATTMLLPSTPVSFTVRSYGYSQVVVTWSNAGGTTSFVVERSADGVSGWTTVGTAAPGYYGYNAVNDSGLTVSTGYYYRVRALNAGGDSAPTAAVAVTTAPPGYVPAGSLDPAFLSGIGVLNASGLPSTVGAIVPQSDGKLIIAGGFAKYAGVAHKSIARLNPDGSVDPTFDPGAWNCVSAGAVAVQPDGKLLVAGSFQQPNGSSPGGIVRLNTDGSVDPTFNATAAISGTSFYPYGILSLAVQADGKALVGSGAVIRLNADGSKDTTYSVPATGDPSFGARLVALLPLSNGNVMVSGDFETINNVSRRGIARLTSTGAVDLTFNANMTGSFNSIWRGLAVQPDGKIVRASGRYSSPKISRFNADGSLDPTFAPPTLSYEGIIVAVALQADGKILIGGGFTTVGGVLRPNIARLNADGSVDTTFDPGLGALGTAGSTYTVTALVVQPGGGILVGGGFTTIAGQPCNGIARLLGSPVTWDALQRWKLDFGLSPIAADTHDDDGDGLPLLAEYALGGNPLLPEPALLPQPVLAADSLSLSYVKLRSDVSYAAEVSTDLMHWTTNGVTQEVSGNTVTASVSLTGAPQKYLHLHITRP